MQYCVNCTQNRKIPLYSIFTSHKFNKRILYILCKYFLSRRFFFPSFPFWGIFIMVKRSRKKKLPKISKIYWFSSIDLKKKKSQILTIGHGEEIINFAKRVLKKKLILISRWWKISWISSKGSHKQNKSFVYLLRENITNFVNYW